VEEGLTAVLFDFRHSLSEIYPGLATGYQATKSQFLLLGSNFNAFR
jgi:hypothetical protein